MIPELGHFSLILALCLTGLQSILPPLGIYKKNQHWIQLATPLMLGQSFFITVSFFCLLYAFLQDDFTVSYVAQHSNAALPTFYKISAVWGGHEGSLLLWIFLLSGWGVIASVCLRWLPREFLARILTVLGLIGFGFLLFLLFTSNPFQRFLPEYPVDGRDLNPLLQDLGLILHPPLLYIGYVGFAIPFAFAVSVLSQPSRELAWAKAMRSWALAAFGFLTLGITLGSWWAYYELGWGGWWFWDPVENVSFMPWLVGIALIHSLMVNDKRQILEEWSLLLAILVFALSLLGTFLVRSGILTSIHAFANDPKRGSFFLIFFMVIIGGALVLYAIQAKRFSVAQRLIFMSRESFIFISILFLLVGAFAVLLGTLFPLLYEAFTGQKLSVGFPYFNSIFIPLMIPVLILIPVGPLSYWKNNVVRDLINKIKWPSIISMILAFFSSLLFMKRISGTFILGLALGLWIAIGTLKILLLKIQKQGSIRSLSLGALGMLSAHLGIAVLVLGVTVVSHKEIEREVAIVQGQSVMLGDEEIIFKDIVSIEGTNYLGQQGRFVVFNQGKKVTELYPEKRLFITPGLKMTETAIAPGFWRDLYIALGEPLKEGGWSARIYYKPGIRWIWLGALLVAIGSFLAAIGRRHR